jgi:hypothetical protein
MAGQCYDSNDKIELESWILESMSSSRCHGSNVHIFWLFGDSSIIL